MLVDGVTGSCRIDNCQSVRSLAGFEVICSLGLGCDSGGAGSNEGHDTGGCVDSGHVHIGR